ncbi:MAG: GTPase Era [Nitrospirae bacterium CG18_big_fil_WC_8_21_14_2_50_70_55]|nr:GTPase Era [Deltaproteobacteria bacterium]OIP62267.1 MAG: GTPase Era [Nitrospirae bacterium CG2_30_70_394]PIQ05691.1 MAG: GTPase Era [Nitrospirae bacterium CG18_big_fil_WC_8_21_14_2_50_70_55]PIU79504.1 MAG: GTPase Era [Nitrospirae bacterium CG06_land_8_20_14_3_00_70_43]PIW83824.1 MAG: GTPase Era [Nitrospirae bacterium CG_4_8_14_3_um_filter_70_85]PIX82195.1 MAG: GTPase Era [Nitrospirae bacterium CG_4_10_14_3_um_filter_70_108]PJB96573.1 MAG: GTPase Era [Nitrospirae bacterium CG_4_9_14_0_8_um
MAPAFRSGFVALAGRPNVGKSTLLNHLVGQKVAITANRPQTTRNRITGVLHGDGFQAVFLDNPGIHRPTHTLNQIMVKTALEGLGEMDLLLLMVEPDRHPGGGDQYIADALRDLGPPVWLLINKIDMVARPQVLAVIDAFKDLAPFAEIFPISAHTGLGVAELAQAIGAVLPAGPPYFPAGMITDLPEQFVVSELIREQVIRRMREELPYGVAVRLDAFEERGEGRPTFVAATILVEREGHKGMVIGVGGAQLKAIGTAARTAIERLLGSRIYLDLRVTAAPNWRNEVAKLRALGFEP